MAQADVVSKFGGTSYPKRKINESKEEADARREMEKHRARKRRGIETEEEGNKRREENAAR